MLTRSQLVMMKFTLVFRESQQCSMHFIISILELHVKSLSWQDWIVLLHYRNLTLLGLHFPMYLFQPTQEIREISQKKRHPHKIKIKIKGPTHKISWNHKISQRSGEKLNTVDLHLQQSNDHHTGQGSHSPWGASTHKVA